jgi:hypothetical protein
MVNKSDAMRMYNFLKARIPDNPRIEIKRLNKALGIVMSGDTSDKQKKYITSFTDCFCPDHWQRGGTFICKHRLAYMIEHPKETVTLAWEGKLK